MIDAVRTVMLDIVRRIQSDVADIKVRVENLEDLGKKQRRGGAAVLVMTRGTAAVLNERLLAVEVDVHQLEGQPDPT